MTRKRTPTLLVAHNLCCVVKAIFTAGLVPTFWPEAPVPASPTPALVRSTP